MTIAIVILIFASGFLFCAVNPLCRKNESTWLFVYTFLVSIPVNFKFCKWVDFVLNFGTKGTFEIVFKYATLAYIWLIILTIEEIVVGIIGKAIWRKQSHVCIKEISNISISEDVGEYM